MRVWVKRNELFAWTTFQVLQAYQDGKITDHYSALPSSCYVLATITGGYLSLAS